MSLPGFSVRNPVLVGLCTWTILVGGAYSGFTLTREMFPELNPHRIMISTIYPGASPVELEKGVAIKIEEAIKDIEEIDEVLTSIGEGFCNIVLVLYNDVRDADQVVTDVKAAIDVIPPEDFPEEAEESQVAKLEPQIPVIHVSYYGDVDEKKLKQIGERMRDELLAIPGITKVVLQGNRADEISIEVKPAKLLEHRLSLPEVALAVRQANLDLPGGQLRTRDANISVRTLGEEDRAASIGRIILRSDDDGKSLRIDQIATVIDGFEDTDVKGRFNAKPAVGVTIFKSGHQDAVDIAKKAKAYVAGKMQQPLNRDWFAAIKHRLGIRDAVEQVYQKAYDDPLPPDGIMATSTDLARFIEGRLELLQRNGFWGLIFVFLSLLFFLNWRVAFWVMAGLLLALFGTLIVMKTFGVSLNLMSMFGLIVVLGLLVDDAIIVGEHIFTRVEQGESPRLAAIAGAEAVAWPVVCAVATTVVAFLPLMFIEGQIGDFMGVLPIIVSCALAVSLFESLSLLPSHLAEWLRPAKTSMQMRTRSIFGRAQHALNRIHIYALQNVLLGGYERILRKAVTYRYVTVTLMVGGLIMSLGMVAGERVPFVYFQKLDSETLIANLEMSVGTPISETDAAIQTIEQAAMSLPDLVSMFTMMGVQYDEQGGTAGVSSHLGQVIFELTSIEERPRNSEDILRQLREDTSDIPGMNALRYSAVHGGPGGAAIQFEISGADIQQLREVARLVKTELSEYEGIYDIDDDFDAGRREVQIELLKSARATGLTTQSLATQIRGAFYGIEARKVQRAREDVKIMVRYPIEHRRGISDVESMWVKTDNGELVPFREVAHINEGRAYATIKRKNQKRTVTITADVDEAAGNANRINAAVATSFPKWQQQFPGIEFEFGGQQREFVKSFGSLWRDFLIAAALIYVILAALFKSYIQPIIVMVAIPFGIVGAVIGHYIMGFPLTILSLIGIVALTGIVVNDSLVLVNWINRRRDEGATPYQAVIDGGTQRLRAILLTSITTILGLAPLLSETSFQARILIPMGVSIAGGVAFATVLTLFAVPSLYMILEDAKGMLRRFWTPANAIPTTA